jgi:hypothetical protein
MLTKKIIERRLDYTNQSCKTDWVLSYHNEGMNGHYHLETRDGGRDLIVGSNKEIFAFLMGVTEVVTNV